MSRRSHQARPVHVILDAEPPAELVEAARRGECIVVTGARPRNVELWGEALGQYCDAVARRERGQRLAELKRTRVENVLVEEDAAAMLPRS